MEKRQIKFDLFDLYTKFIHEKKLNFSNNDSKKQFIDNMNQELSSCENDILKYGKKTELGFYFIVKSLNGVKSIEQIDCGISYFCENVIKPDYIIILKDGEKILVETKNNNHSIEDEYCIKKKYYDNLMNYSSLHKIDLYIAIFWRKIRMWTLNRITDFKNDKGNYTMLITKACEKNYMNLLGDYMIGTLFPITIRLYINDDYVIDGKTIEFVIKRIELLCQNKLIIDKREKNIAFFLYLYCSEWDEKQHIVKDTNGKLSYIEYYITPKEDNDKQEFSMIGFLSTLYMNQYDSIAQKNNAIRDFYLDHNLGFDFDPSYSGNTLKLWRFKLKPSD